MSKTKIDCIGLSYEEYHKLHLWKDIDFYLPPISIGIVDRLYVFIDRKTDNIVGFFAIYYKLDNEDMPYTSIYVLEEYRGLGIANIMYNNAMKESENEYLFAIVDRNNTISHRAHSKLGVIYSENKRYGKTVYLIE